MFHIISVFPLTFFPKTLGLLVLKNGRKQVTNTERGISHSIAVFCLTVHSTVLSVTRKNLKIAGFLASILFSNIPL